MKNYNITLMTIIREHIISKQYTKLNNNILKRKRIIKGTFNSLSHVMVPLLKLNESQSID